MLARLFGLPPPGAASGDGVLVLPAEGVCDSRTRATSSSSEPLCLILNPLSRGVERPGSSSGTLVSERSEEALRYLTEGPLLKDVLGDGHLLGRR